VKTPIGLKSRAAIAANDPRLQAAILKACDHAIRARACALDRLPDPLAAREAAIRVRTSSVERMHGLLDRLEQRLAAAGVIVHRAETAQHACEVVSRIARKHRVRTVVKAKTMTGEEVGLTAALERTARVVETDLGEFIVQLRAEPPSHILAPALHLTRADVARLFAERLGMPASDDPAAICGFARRHLRAEFLAADLGVIGVNAAVAETAELVTLSNEGNARLCAALPRVLVAIAGIEKVVETRADLAAILRVLPRNATGQTATTYASFLRGPAPDRDAFGPREVHLVLVDNGRSRIAQDPDLRDTLRCIRCGACLNVCPVYRTIGGHAYGTTYPGPMGLLWTAGLAGVDQVRDLLEASTLCGECTRVCPAGIDIARGIRKLRARTRKPFLSRVLFRIARLVLAGATRVRWAGRLLATLARVAPSWYSRLARMIGWTTRADVPVPAAVPFRALALPEPAPTRILQAPDAARTGEPPAPGVRGPVRTPLDALRSGLLAAGAEVIQAAGPDAGIRSLVERSRPRRVLASASARLEPARNVLSSLGIPVLLEPEATKDEAAQCDLGLTDCVALVAETGSVLLEHRTELVASLLPDVHAVIAFEDQVVSTLEEALNHLHDSRAYTLITGPSRTADIEKTLILGMHGPRRLLVILIGSG